jgi:hypothetical protein
MISKSTRFVVSFPEAEKESRIVRIGVIWSWIDRFEDRMLVENWCRTCCNRRTVLPTLLFLEQFDPVVNVNASRFNHFPVSHQTRVVHSFCDRGSRELVKLTDFFTVFQCVVQEQISQNAMRFWRRSSHSGDENGS